MKCLRSSAVGNYEITAVLGVNVRPVEADGAPACMSHFGLVSVIGQKSVGQDKPSFLIT